jgi:hypothetical protein
MVWTFLIGASAVYVMVLSGVLIDITDSTLVLLGIAGVARRSTYGARVPCRRTGCDTGTGAEVPASLVCH